MPSRLFAFAIWALVAAGLMFWGLRLFASSPVAPTYTVSALDGQGLRGDLARVFGEGAPVATVAAAPPAPEASRFKLVGVAAPRDANVVGGLALISVDGKPARAINVGRTIDDGWILQSVNRRGARLSSNLGANTVDLEIPPLALANRGTLPATGNSGSNSNAGVSNGAAPITPIAPPAPAPIALPSAGAVPSGAPGVGASNSGVAGPNYLGGAVEGRVVTNPVVTQLPSSSQPQQAGSASGPPAIFVPPEELTRQPGRSRSPKAASGTEPSEQAPPAQTQ